MSIRKIVRQIQELAPNRAYAIVINHPLRQEELKDLKTICENARIRAVLLTDSRVVPLDQLFMVLAKADEATLAELAQPDKPIGPGSVIQVPAEAVAP